MGALKGSGNPRQALDDGVVGGLIVVSATLSEGDDAAVDEAWVQGMQRVPIQAGPR